MTLQQEIDRLGGVNRLANVSEAESILSSQGAREVRPYLATGIGAGDLFVIVGGARV